MERQSIVLSVRTGSGGTLIDHFSKKRFGKMIKNRTFCKIRRDNKLKFPISSTGMYRVPLRDGSFVKVWIVEKSRME